MFALKKAGSRVKIARFGGAKRFASTHYGPEEPLAPYIKWVAALSAGIAVVTYDRFYSDGAITRMVTPESRASEQVDETLKAVEAQWKAQERPIALFDTRPRQPSLETFTANPVPTGHPRAEHTSDLLDISEIGERRPRASPHGK